MHIAEGVLSAPVLVGGAVIAAAGVMRGLRDVDADNVPRVGLLAAALFVASLVRVPLGVSSVHLILNGLAGLLLGWMVFPALLVALLLQAILFQFGGLTTLGVNTTIMAAPAAIVWLLFGGLLRRSAKSATTGAFAAGALAILLGGTLFAAALWLSGDAFWSTAVAVLAAHVPLMIIEGAICAACVAYLRKVKPTMLGPTARKARESSDHAEPR